MTYEAVLICFEDESKHVVGVVFLTLYFVLS